MSILPPFLTPILSPTLQEVANYLIYKVSSVIHTNKWGVGVLDYAITDSKLWGIVVDNIKSLKGMKHKSKKVQKEIAAKYQKEFQQSRQSQTAIDNPTVVRILSMLLLSRLLSRNRKYSFCSLIFLGPLFTLNVLA